MKQSKNIFIPIILIVLFLLIGIDQELTAQCPMCRMSAESNLQNGGTEGRSLNKGILYLLALPYLFVSVLGYLWYTNRKKETEDIN